MKIACLLPKRNNGQYFLSSIESLCAQSLPYDQILVCENFSTDGSSDQAFLVAAASSKIHAFRPDAEAESFGASCFELISKMPEADFYHIASSDDVWGPSFLRELGECALLDSDVAAVFCDRIYIDSRGRRIAASGNIGVKRIIPQAQALSYFLRGNAYNVAGAIFRRDVIKNALAFARSTGQAFDWALIIEASRLGSIGYVCKALYSYRLHPGSTAATATYSPSGDIQEYLRKSGLQDVFWQIHGLAQAYSCSYPDTQAPKKSIIPLLKIAAHRLGIFGLIRKIRNLE
jgi:glycosyltransferase involved in cell wall biosynthesis